MTSREQRDLDKLLALVEIKGSPEMREIASDYRRHSRQGATHDSRPKVEDLCINPRAVDNTAFTTSELLSLAKLAIMFKTGAERAQIASDAQLVLEQLEEREEEREYKRIDRLNERNCTAAQASYDLRRYTRR
jgi:hypothetical protein